MSKKTNNPLSEFSLPLQMVILWGGFSIMIIVLWVFIRDELLGMKAFTYPFEVVGCMAAAVILAGITLWLPDPPSNEEPD